MVKAHIILMASPLLIRRGAIIALILGVFAFQIKSIIINNLLVVG